MTEINSNLNLYQVPSNDILRYRKEFYDLWRRIDDPSMTWLNRVQNQIERCEFPPLMSREYILIDRFMCELNDDEKDIVGTVEAWTPTELTEYFLHQKQTNDHQMNEASAITESIDQHSEVRSSPLLIAVRSESVSKFVNFLFISSVS